MNAQETVAEALASRDIQRIRRAIDVTSERVRTEGTEARLAFAETLLPLMGHAEPKVRQSVAAASDLLSDAAFDRALELFSADDDHYVRMAMERAAKRRSVKRVTRAKSAEQEQVVAELLATIESKYDRGARRLAERTVRRGTEYFVSKLHHEASKIVTPLEYSLHKLRAEVQKPHADPAVLARHIEVACDRLSYLWAIVDRARDATRMVTPRFEPTPLRALLDEARGHLIERLGARAERLSFGIEVSADLAIDIDRTSFLQAVQNFLQNAAEAYPDDAPRLAIDLAARSLRAGSQVELTITDHGMGMTHEQQADLFVPFGSRKPGGTGVGLVIARAMIQEVHGGTLTLTSARGAGTTVTVVMPARQNGARKGS